MIHFKTVSSIVELEQILMLQEVNLRTAVSEEEKEQEGFVTVQHDLAILTKMNTKCPHIIAKDGEKVVGYALCMHPQFGNDIDILKPMFAEINSVVPPKTNYVAMGQICVDKGYRKQGIFRGLYQTMQEVTSPEFSAIITEVDAENIRSLNAHYAVGFTCLKTYHANGQDWELIALSG